MNDLQNIKFVNVTPPAAIVDDASYTTTAIDTLGFNELAVVVQLGATDIDMVALKLQESDDSGMSGAVDITGTVYGTSLNPDTGTALALPLSTEDNGRVVFFVKLNGRKRYIDLVATAGNGATGTYATAIGMLVNGIDVPSTAALRGLLSNAIV